MPEDGASVKQDEVIAYIDGTYGIEPCLCIRLDDVKKGEYFVLYKPDFKPWHLVKRLNIVFYSEFQPKRSAAEVKMLDIERRIKMDTDSKVNLNNEFYKENMGEDEAREYE